MTVIYIFSVIRHLMFTMRLFPFQLPACLSALLFMTVSVFAMEPGLDALVRPSIQSLRAQRLIMNSVVTAGQRLVACGERGTVMLSDDGGKNWRQSASVPVSVTLTRSYFVDDKIGWSVGHSGVVLGTRDGGEHWTLLLDGKRAATLEKEAAQAAGPNAERLPQAERLVQDGADKPFFGLHFFDANRGLVVGAYGLAIATEDGGKTWQSAMGRIDNPKGHHLYAIHADGQDLYIAAEQGELYRSSDGGKQFKSLETSAKGTFFGLVSAKDKTLLAYGLRGALYRSGDGGGRWERVELPAITITSGLTLKNGSIVLTDEAGHLLQSRDDGKSFKAVPQSRTAPVVSIAQAEDGQLVLAGVSNLRRLVLDNSTTETK